MNEKELLQISIRIKRTMLGLYFQAKAGHVGSSLSACEIATHIHFACKKKDEIFVLSKGHASALLYSVLKEKGDVSQEDIDTFYQEGTLFAGHPPGLKIPGILFGTGSLGHGASLSAGLALSHKLKGLNDNVYCLCSDGELNEGSTWEALLFARQFDLNNLFIYIDRNKIQGFGYTEEVMALEPMVQKFSAFGCDVEECNGHDFKALQGAHEKLVARKSKGPKVIVGHTIKGNGYPDLENTVDCHYLPMTKQQYEMAIENLKKQSAVL